MAAQLKHQSIRVIMLLISFSLLSACGFHLRGALEISDDKQTINLQADQAGGMLAQSLKRSLRDNAIEQLADAPYQLSILKSHFKRSSVSLDSSARVDEYSLSLSVEYRLTNTTTDKTEAQSSTIERVYSYDQDAAAAKDEQEVLLRQEMYDAMATRIIRRYLAFDTDQ
ncbi:MAG: LPS assembly lipoprotein LptE [Pontibacterium sp.]